MPDSHVQDEDTFEIMYNRACALIQSEQYEQALEQLTRGFPGLISVFLLQHYPMIKIVV